MSKCSLVKMIAKMGMDELAMLSAKRALKERLGESFTQDQKEVIIEALDWITKEMQQAWRTKVELRALLRKESMDRMKSMRDKLMKTKLPKSPDSQGGC